MKIHLISYGDHNYVNQKVILKKTAVNSLFFNSVSIFSLADLGQSFLKVFHNVIFQQKGGGFWIWKPYLIKAIYDELSSEDVLVYCDAGCIINNLGKKRFDDYIDMIADSETGTLAFELPHKEIEYTKREVFDYFKSGQEMLDSNQLMATIVLFRKTKHATEIINQWYNVLYDDPLLFTDEMDRKNQDDTFIDHRHDQSILSVIRKIHGAEIIADETYFTNFNVEGTAFPFWAARLRG